MFYQMYVTEICRTENEKSLNIDDQLKNPLKINTILNYCWTENEKSHNIDVNTTKGILVQHLGLNRLLMQPGVV